MKRDLRQYASQTSLRLILGVLAITLILGNLLIAIFFGFQAAILSLICMSAALIPVGLICLVLWGIDWLANRNNHG